MKVLSLVLIFMSYLYLLLFFRFPPENANKEQVKVFNQACIVVFFILALTWSWNVAITLSAANVVKYRPLFITGGILGIDVVFFTTMFLIRNFWIFREKRGGRPF